MSSLIQSPPNHTVDSSTTSNVPLVTSTSTTTTTATTSRPLLLAHEDDGQIRYAGAKRLIHKKKQHAHQQQHGNQLSNNIINHHVVASSSQSNNLSNNSYHTSVAPTLLVPPAVPSRESKNTLKASDFQNIQNAAALQRTLSPTSTASSTSSSYIHSPSPPPSSTTSTASAPLLTQTIQPPAPHPSSPPPPSSTSTTTIHPDIDSDHNLCNKLLGDYQLMESIGRGGFGIVYRGLDIKTGRTVAVKRVSLYGIQRDELESIEAEINLLKNLSHPNIVCYYDSIRTEKYLHIILEFAENGSLSGLLSKFGGKLPEPLVSHYTAQVLAGLHYLHSQGVIHRDIKGANILSTKDGSIKLADFGVATSFTNTVSKQQSVVGTPYWMAPEIIEMTGQQSSACDIWSVGCTVIELLTGKPPYYDLQQMPALFRIVQDEHPPLPDICTRELEDFLLQCFQKDPNRRIDASGLLRHTWLKKTVEKLQHLVQPILSHSTAQPGIQGHNALKNMTTNTLKPIPSTTTATTMKPLVESLDLDEDEDWDQELENEQMSSNHSGHPVSGQNGSVASSSVPLIKPQLITPDVIKQILSKQQQSSQHTGTPSGTSSTTSPLKPTTSSSTSSSDTTSSSVLSSSSLPTTGSTTTGKPKWAVNTMNAPGTTSNKVILQRKTSLSTPTHPSTTSSSKSSRPSAPITNPTNTMSQKLDVIDDGDEDFMDLDEQDDQPYHNPNLNHTIPRVSTTTSTNHVNSVISPNKLPPTGGENKNMNKRTSIIQPSNNNIKRDLKDFEEDDNESYDMDDSIDDLEIQRTAGGGINQSGVHPRSMKNSASTGGTGVRRGSEMVKGGGGGEGVSSTGTDTDDDSIFDDLDSIHEGGGSGSVDVSFNNGIHAHLGGGGGNYSVMSGNSINHGSSGASHEMYDTTFTKQYNRLIGHLIPNNDEKLLLDSLQSLLTLATDEKSTQQVCAMMVHNGVVPMIEMLESIYPPILYLTLKLINLVSTRNLKYQYNLCLAGIIPIIIRIANGCDHNGASTSAGGTSNIRHTLRYTLPSSTSSSTTSSSSSSSSQYTMDIRMETANFIRLLCYNSDFTRKLFIACDGLPILVDFLIDYGHSSHNNMALIYNTIDCIRHVFDIQSSPKNDFCRLFCKYNLLSPLTSALIQLIQYRGTGGGGGDGDIDTDILDHELYIKKISQILLLFSEGDKHVKVHLAEHHVLTNILNVISLYIYTLQHTTTTSTTNTKQSTSKTYATSTSSSSSSTSSNTPPQPLIHHECISLLLKCIKNISMESSTLDSLEEANTIPIVLPLLAPMIHTHPIPSDHQTTTLLLMYYLCQIKTSRQESAAIHGIIPHCIHIIKENSPLKQFAYPIIFLIGKSSTRSRLELKKYQGIDFLITCLKDSYWRTHSLEVLTIWLAEDKIRCEFLLNTAYNIQQLIQCFLSTSNAMQSEKILPLFLKLIQSHPVNLSLGNDLQFIRELKVRLENPHNSNITRKELLRIVALLIVPTNNRALQYMIEEGMVNVLYRLVEDKEQVVIVPLAEKLIQRFKVYQQQQLQVSSSNQGVGSQSSAGSVKKSLVSTPMMTRTLVTPSMTAGTPQQPVRMSSLVKSTPN